MTFKKFEELFKTKYPDAYLCQHGKFAGTEGSGKVAIAFNAEGKVYEYYGAYEDILNRIGLKVISNSRLSSIETSLRRYKEWQYDETHGKSCSLFGKPHDYSADIERLEREIADIKANYIIV